MKQDISIPLSGNGLNESGTLLEKLRRRNTMAFMAFFLLHFGCSVFGMNYFEIIGLISGLLQLAVAAYALRLNRLFGMTRVGWSLFSAFGLLAFLHLTLSLGSLQTRTDSGIKVDVVYALISILLLIGMAHLESLLKERLQVDQMREKAQVEMRQRVGEKTEALTRANEELRATTAKLRAEIVERKQMQEQMQRTHNELMAVSREAGMSEVATGVLHNVGNVLNSVNVSASLVADHLQQLKIHNVARAAKLMQDQGENIGLFMSRDSRGKQLPDYLAQLADHLHEEQSLLLREIGFVKKKIEHIKEIVATQQNYGKVSALTEKVQITDLVEDVLRIQLNDLTKSAVQVKREYEPKLPEVIVDKHKVLQILLNLIANARHACLESGQRHKQVTVRVTNGDDRVRVVMSDNGVGIPSENLKKVFNHGFTTKKKGGHGFGLHSGALAAKEMGGALLAESSGVGRGATFTLELPLQSKAQKAG